MIHKLVNIVRLKSWIPGTFCRPRLPPQAQLPLTHPLVFGSTPCIGDFENIVSLVSKGTLMLMVTNPIADCPCLSASSVCVTLVAWWRDIRTSRVIFKVVVMR